MDDTNFVALFDAHWADVYRYARSIRLSVRAVGDMPPGPPDPATGVVQRQELAEALMALGEDDREVLLLVGWEQLSMGDAAAALGCTETAFRVRLHRARKRLRRQLPDSVLTPRPSPALGGAS